MLIRVPAASPSLLPYPYPSNEKSTRDNSSANIRRLDSRSSISASRSSSSPSLFVLVVAKSPKCCEGVVKSSSSRDTCSVKGSFTLPLALLSEADESEAPNSNGIGEAREENEGL